MSKRHSRLSLSGPTWKELGKSWTNWKSTTLFRSHKELRSQAKLLLWKPESQGDRENQSFLEAEGCGWRRDWGEPHSGAAGGSVWSSQKGPVFKGLYTFVSFNLMTRPGSQRGDCRKIPCSCTSRKKRGGMTILKYSQNCPWKKLFYQSLPDLEEGKHPNWPPFNVGKGNTQLQPPHFLSQLRGGE